MPSRSRRGIPHRSFDSSQSYKCGRETQGRKLPVSARQRSRGWQRRHMGGGALELSV